MRKGQNADVKSAAILRILKIETFLSLKWVQNYDVPVDIYCFINVFLNLAPILGLSFMVSR